MFTIIKTVSGVWYHLFNNGATKVHLSDFDVIIDAIAETYVIEAKNGSNIPSQAISISDIRVIDDSVSTTIPIPFSGATGLIELLTSLGYPPYLNNTPAQPPVKVWSKGDAISINKTQTWIDANFDATGLGINEAVGWAKRNGQNGTRDAQDRSLLNQGTKFTNVGILYGFENTVLVAHDHDSIEYSDGKKGVNTVGKGATVAGRAIAESSATDKTNKTSKDGKTYLGVPSNVETGVGKNYHPILVELFIERVSDLWITGGSSTSTTPNLAEVLSNNNKTNDIPIVSNNGNGYLYVNDEQTILGNDFGGTKKITISEDTFRVDSTVRIDVEGKGINMNTTTDGFLMPRVTTTQMNAIDVLLLNESLLVYNTTESKFYKYDGTDWVVFGESSGSGTVTNVSGTTDEITVSNPTTTPVVGISSTYTTARNSYADAKVADNLTASTTVAPSKTAVNTALDLKIDETSWVDYSAISTVVGCSSYTTKKIIYKILDNIMFVDFNLEGPSNTTLPFSFTIPSNASAFSFVLSAYIVNVGAAQNFPGRISSVAGSNVITIQRDGQNTAFTGSGTRRCSGQFFIQL